MPLNSLQIMVLGLRLTGELTRYVDGLEVEYEERRVEDDYKILA